MKKTVFTGACVALVTPMNNDGSVNYKMLDNLIEFQINNGTDAILICGTSGESATLSLEEHSKVIDYAINKVAKRIPVIAGTGSNCTQTAVDLSLEAQKSGADAVLVVTPYYNKTTQQGLIKHYNYIADMIDIPMIVYNVPSRTSLNILPQTYLELSKHPNIVAAKEANGNLTAMAETISLVGDNLDIYSGEDYQITPTLSLGGKGIISVLSNVMPQLTHDICAEFFNGNVKKSAELQIGAIGLIKALFCETSPMPAKAALELMGYKVGECRMPLTTMLPQNLELLKNELKLRNLI